jgi:hypothetical protein
MSRAANIHQSTALSTAPTFVRELGTRLVAFNLIYSRPDLTLIGREVLRKYCAPAAPESAIAGEISVPDGEILTIYENHYSLVEADELKELGRWMSRSTS